MTKHTYSAGETLQILGIPRSTFYRYIRENQLSHLHPIAVGNKVVFPKRVIDALVAGQVA